MGCSTSCDNLAEVSQEAQVQPNPVWREEGTVGGSNAKEQNFHGINIQTQKSCSTEQQGRWAGQNPKPSQSWLFYTGGHPVPKFL
jgi:hypothetical protein